jgi:signal transduction histidine kinase
MLPSAPGRWCIWGHIPALPPPTTAGRPGGRVTSSADRDAALSPGAVWGDTNRVVTVSGWIHALGTFYGQYGYLLVLLGALLENTALLGLILPGGTLALLGAFYARTGSLNLAVVILLAWAGTVIGYHADYLLGRYALGSVVARVSGTRLGRRLRLKGRTRQAQSLLNRHGGKAILVSHTVGHVRSFVALSAGATRMRYRRFLAFELVAALIWNTIYGLAGYTLGGQIERLQGLLANAGWVLIVVALVGFGGWRYLRPRLRGWLARAWRWLDENSFTPHCLMGRRCPPALGYLLATLFPLLAIVIDLALMNLFPTLNIMGRLELLVVALMALTWGAGPSLLATLVGAALINFAGEPRLEWRLQTADDVVELGVFLVAGIIISIVGSRAVRARREAQLANQQMDTFVSSVSHELRQPLTIIKGALQLTRRRAAQMTAGADESGGQNELTERLEAVRWWIERAEHEADLLNRLIDDLLDVTRIQSRTFTLQPAPCDLGTTVREQVERQRLAWPGRTITLEAPADVPLPVVADRHRIEQVITNFLTNALKYSAETCPVTVSVQRERTQARVAVCDQGPGLSAEEQERIWQRFYRAKSVVAQSKNGAGLGLGLHISKTIVEQHHGKVGVISTEGQGSTFWFTLPLASERSALAPGGPDGFATPPAGSLPPPDMLAVAVPLATAPTHRSLLPPSLTDGCPPDGS